MDVLEKLFAKIPFPINIWLIEDCLTLKLQYTNDNYQNMLTDGMLLSAIKDTKFKDFLINKTRIDIINKNYITIYNFIDEHQFYELNISKNNLEYILSSISYKIRNPLTNIIGLLPVLKSCDKSKVAEYYKYINIIKESSGNIVGVANNIIDILNIYQDKINIKNEDHELNNLIRCCIEPFKNAMAKKNNKIIFKVHNAMPIKTDKLKFEQIVIIILDNAQKFTDNGIIQINVTKKDNSYIIKIKDSGCGMAKERQEFVNKVLNVDTEEIKNTIGTGLGLFICKHICKEMNIGLSYKSQEGVGTTFYLNVSIIQ